MRPSTRPSLAYRWPLLTLITLPATAFASDPTGLAWLLLAITIGAFIVIYPVIWIASRQIKRAALRILLRAFALSVFWAPTYVGGSWIVWAPAGPAMLEADLVPRAMLSIALSTLLLWLVCMGIRTLTRKQDDSAVSNPPSR